MTRRACVRMRTGDQDSPIRVGGRERERESDIENVTP